MHVDNAGDTTTTGVTTTSTVADGSHRATDGQVADDCSAPNAQVHIDALSSPSMSPTPSSPSSLAMTAEERTKQKRMLRNRESAARSRDKQKTRNLHLQSSIKAMEKRRDAVEDLVDQVGDVVAEMRRVLNEHGIKVT